MPASRVTMPAKSNCARRLCSSSFDCRSNALRSTARCSASPASSATSSTSLRAAAVRPSGRECSRYSAPKRSSPELSGTTSTERPAVAITLAVWETPGSSARLSENSGSFVSSTRRTTPRLKRARSSSALVSMLTSNRGTNWSPSRTTTNPRSADVSLRISRSSASAVAASSPCLRSTRASDSGEDVSAERVTGISCDRVIARAGP